MGHIPLTNTGAGGVQTGPALTQSAAQTHALAVNDSESALVFQLSDGTDVSPPYMINGNSYLIVPFPGTGAHNIVNVQTTHATPSQLGEFLFVFQVDPPVNFATVNDEHYAN